MVSAKAAAIVEVVIVEAAATDSADGKALRMDGKAAVDITSLGHIQEESSSLLGSTQECFCKNQRGGRQLPSYTINYTII